MTRFGWSLSSEKPIRQFLLRLSALAKKGAKSSTREAFSALQVIAEDANRRLNDASHSPNRGSPLGCESSEMDTHPEKTGGRDEG
jgi:hypothetical protein